MVDALEFGAFIKILREKLDLSIHELSSVSGISVSYLSRVERGLRDVPKPDYLRKLALGLNIDYEELLRAAGFLDPYEQSSPRSDTSEKSPAMDLKKLLAQQEVTFDGVPLTDEDRKMVEEILTKLFKEAKQMNIKKMS